jgi:hypothetical protein
MHLFRRFRPSPALVLAAVALFVALGGTSYAVIRLPRNSVTTVQVKDFSLLARDFKRGQIPRGAVGPAGPAGPQGPAGPAGPAGGSATAKWAIVRPDGGIVAQSGGITLAAKPAAGQYLLNIGSSVAGKPILVSGGYANDTGDQRGETSAGPCNGGTDGINCSASNNSNTVFVETRNNDGFPADHAFYIAIFG